MDATINVVVIATRHDSHAHFVCRALEAGKHVFVEKPLALIPEELEQIVKAYTAAQARYPCPTADGGFQPSLCSTGPKNKQLLAGVQAPKSLILTVNAGRLRLIIGHRTHRLGADASLAKVVISSTCAFLGSSNFGIQATMVGEGLGKAVREDKMSFTLAFTDGSFAHPLPG